MTFKPISRHFRTIDESLEWMDGILEDKLRQFQTAALIDIPARGVEVDHDFVAEMMEEQRRDWAIQREQIRATLVREWTPSRHSPDRT